MRLFLLLLLLLSPTTVLSQPRSFEPVRNGDGWLFTDPEYGFSLSYSDDFKFRSQQTMKAILEARGSNMQSSPNHSTRMTLGAVRLKREKYVPNLTASVQGRHPALDPLTNLEYANSLKERMTAGDGAIFQGAPQPEIINDVEFYRFELVQEVTGRPLYSRVYCHYDSDALLGYIFLLSTRSQKHRGSDLDFVEKAFRTVRLTKRPGPAPAEKLREMSAI